MSFLYHACYSQWSLVTDFHLQLPVQTLMNHSRSNCMLRKAKTFSKKDLIDVVVMEWRNKSKQMLSKLIMEEEGSMKPTVRYSTHFVSLVILSSLLLSIIYFRQIMPCFRTKKKEPSFNIIKEIKRDTTQFARYFHFNRHS